MKKQRLFARIVAILLVLAMLAGSGFYLVYMISPADYAVYAADADEKALQQLADLEDVLKTIQANYRDKVTMQSLVDGAYNGVFSVLDAWSEYYPTTEDEEVFTNSLSQESYCGVGMTLTNNSQGQCVVTALNPKGSAYEQGVHTKDIITKVGGKSVQGWTTTEIANALRGNEGTKVVVELLRSGQPYTVTLQRRMLTVTITTYEMVEGTTIGYIDVDNFNDGAADSLYDSYLELLSLGAEKFIIDLRDNPGGYMDEAMEAACTFLPKGADLLTYVSQGEEQESYYVGYEDDFYQKYPIVILINEETASAAEAFTVMLRDNNAATVVGTTSYGKGVYQMIFDGKDESSFKLSCGYFYGPKKKTFDSVGVKPDYFVYNGSGITESEAQTIANGIVPMKEKTKYLTLYSYGLNVLGAQQRLKVLGYNVPINGILTAETMQALKEIQKMGGGCPYGGLDYTTMGFLEAQYQAFLYGTTDAQMAKAVELLK